MFERIPSWLHAVLLFAFLLLACTDDPSRPEQDSGEALNDATQRGSDDAGGASADPQDIEAGSEDAGGPPADADAGDLGQEPPFAPGSFSATHTAEITKDCAETLQCNAQMGEALPSNAMQECLEDTALALERGGESKQRRYLTLLERCNTRVACEYYACARMRVGD